MLDRFNQSEHERLEPIWRRARMRLGLASLAAVIVGLWALATFWEAY